MQLLVRWYTFAFHFCRRHSAAAQSTKPALAEMSAHVNVGPAVIDLPRIPTSPAWYHIECSALNNEHYRAKRD